MGSHFLTESRCTAATCTIWEPCNKSNRLKFPSDLRVTHLNGDLSSDLSDLSITLKKNPRNETYHTQRAHTTGNATVAHFLMVGGIPDARPCFLNLAPPPPFCVSCWTFCASVWRDMEVSTRTLEMSRCWSWPVKVNLDSAFLAQTTPQEPN